MEYLRAPGDRRAGRPASRRNRACRKCHSSEQK